MTRGRAWDALFAIGAALSVAQLYLAPHVPSMDLPEHLASMATLRHFADPSFYFGEYVTLEAVGRTNYVLYHLLGAGFTALLGSAERANLFLLSLVAVALPYAARALYAALGRDTRMAIVTFPLFWSRPLAEGLVSFVASTPIVLFSLALAVRQAEAPTRRRALGLAALAIVVFYLHPVSFGLMSAGVVLVNALLTPRGERWRAPLLRVGWLVPALAVIVRYAVVRSAAPIDPAGVVHGNVLHFIPRTQLAVELLPWLHDYWRTWVDDAAGAALWFGVALTAAAHGRPAADARARVAVVLPLLALGFYFALPTQIGSPRMGILTQIDQRMSLYVGLLVPLVVPARPGRRVVGEIGLALATAASFLLAVHGCWRARRYEIDEAGALDRVAHDLPRGLRVLGLSFDANSRHAKVAPFVHASAYLRTRLGGVSSPSFVNVPHWPIHYLPGRAPPTKDDLVWEYHPCAFDNLTDGPWFDVVLVRGERDPFERRPPGPRWRVLARDGAFALYGKTGETEPPRPGAHGPCD